MEQMAGLSFIFCLAIYSATAAETVPATPEKQRKIMNSMGFVQYERLYLDITWYLPFFTQIYFPSLLPLFLPSCLWKCIKIFYQYQFLIFPLG